MKFARILAGRLPILRPRIEGSALAWATALLIGAMAVSPFAARAQQQSANDDVLLQMRDAAKRGDKARLSELLPLARGNPLEPWAAYWELKARLQEASDADVQAFLARYAGSYQEDRLRNDWLLLLGQRRDWANFDTMQAGYRMQDDPEVRCYSILVDALKNGGATQAMADEVRDRWMAERKGDDGCTLAADRMFAANLLKPEVAWDKARLAVEAKRPQSARAAITIIAPDALPLFEEANKNAARFLASHAPVSQPVEREVALLALLRIANTDPDMAARLLDGGWSVQLTPEQRDRAWGEVGRQQTLNLSPAADGAFAKVLSLQRLPDDTLGWRVRAALRAGDWKRVAPAIDAMSAQVRDDSIWVYWKARATLRSGNERQRAEARTALRSIAGTRDFYEQLALDELGLPVVVQPEPAPLTAAERAAAAANPSLQRALYAIAIGLRPEGVREWNYATNLHQKGGMNDRELLAAADLACQREVYDRCINTSERTKSVVDTAQRFPMPFRAKVVARAREVGIEAAYVYGLIRQESRFIMDARSGVGASGLMQVMPATARWTARKIGLDGFSTSQLNDRDTNIQIGTAYLKLALDDFDDSMALAAAAYNAGPGRPRRWREGPTLETAIWAESIPFSETRDYVKKVIANTTNYAAVLTGKPQSIKDRLGTIGPRPVSDPEPNKDLP